MRHEEIGISVSSLIRSRYSLINYHIIKSVVTFIQLIIEYCQIWLEMSDSETNKQTKKKAGKKKVVKTKECATDF